MFPVQAAGAFGTRLCKFRVAAIRRGRLVAASEGPRVDVTPRQPGPGTSRPGRWCPPVAPVKPHAQWFGGVPGRLVAASEGPRVDVAPRQPGPGTSQPGWWCPPVAPVMPHAHWFGGVPGSVLSTQSANSWIPGSVGLSGMPWSVPAEPVSGLAVPQGMTTFGDASWPVSAAPVDGWCAPLSSAAGSVPWLASDASVGVVEASPDSLEAVSESRPGAGALVEGQTGSLGAESRSTESQSSLERSVSSDGCCVAPGAAVVSASVDGDGGAPSALAVVASGEVSPPSGAVDEAGNEHALWSARVAEAGESDGCSASLAAAGERVIWPGSADESSVSSLAAAGEPDERSALPAAATEALVGGRSPSSDAAAMDAPLLTGASSGEVPIIRDEPETQQVCSGQPETRSHDVCGPCCLWSAQSGRSGSSWRI